MLLASNAEGGGTSAAGSDTEMVASDAVGAGAGSAGGSFWKIFGSFTARVIQLN